MKCPYQSASHGPGEARPRSVALWPLAAWTAAVLIMGAGGLMSNGVMAAETGRIVEFDTTFLPLDPAGNVDASRFARGNMVAPDVYDVDIWMNGNRIERAGVRFGASSDGVSAEPCFTRAMLGCYGVDVSPLAPIAGDECVDIGSFFPDATVSFDSAGQSLALAIPQKYVSSMASGAVAPELWSSGVNAGFLSYHANAYRTCGGSANSNQTYLGLNSGVNVDGWYLRHQSSVMASAGQPTQFDDIATYVEHDLTTWSAQATLGESQTTGEIFDSVSFRGAQIATDDRMLPDSMRGFAPVVRGMADSNARVTIRQNGQVIDERSVPPGPFEIRDLYATGYGGDLDITVTEADGRSKSFTVPYASMPQSMRPGTTRFAVTAGRLRDDSLQTTPDFAQATMQRGLTGTVTLVGGALASTGYLAANLGVAFKTKSGAFAGDVTAARTELPGHPGMAGERLHIGYSRFFDPTGTNLALGGYRYSDSGYLNFSDAARARDAVLNGASISDRQRGRMQLTLNQPIRNHGSLYATTSSQRYWNRPGRDLFFQAGYSGSFRYGTYGMSAGRTANSDGSLSNEIMLTTTVALGHSSHAPHLSTNVNLRDSSGVQTSVSGAVGESDQYAYNAYGSVNSTGSPVGADAGMSGAYRGPYAHVTAAASGGANASQVSAGVSGTIVAHPGGVTFSQTVGDTFGIVEAKGAEGATITSASGVKVDSRGYAVLPSMSPYRMNRIDIDPKGSAEDVEFGSTSEQAAPRAGSIVMLKYRTAAGRATLVRATPMNGVALPFGADGTDESGRVAGAVAGQQRHVSSSL
jgi:outer membrane usher protein